MFGNIQKPQVDPITYFAEADARGKRIKFGIKDSDRAKHLYLIGMSGMGKSTLLENLAAQDIQNGNGLCFIDPHGSAIDTLLDYIPEDRIDDVVYFAPFDLEYPIAFNPLENTDEDKRHLIAQGLSASFKKIWGEETFSDRMEHIINNTLLALLEYPDATLLSIPRMYTDDAFRGDVISYITDPSVKAFWTQEFAGWTDRYRQEALPSILNKVGQFTSNPLVRNIIGQPHSSFDFRELLDNKKILLVNLSIGQIGEGNANLLGSMLTTKIFLAGMSRADLHKSDLDNIPPFYVYIDEFQNLANDSLANILSQSRKYKLSLTLAHQYVEQLPETVRAAVFGNVSTKITFKIGAADAEIFEKEFAPKFLVEDFMNMGVYQIYLKLSIDGVSSMPFSARTLPPLARPAVSFRQEIIARSREQFANGKEEVHGHISEWMLSSFKSKQAKPAHTKNTNTPPRQSPSNTNKPHTNTKSAYKSPHTTTPAKQNIPQPARPAAPQVTQEMKEDLPGKNSFADALKDAFVSESDVQSQVTPTGKQPQSATPQAKSSQHTSPRQEKQGAPKQSQDELKGFLANLPKG